MQTTKATGATKGSALLTLPGCQHSQGEEFSPVKQLRAAHLLAQDGHLPSLPLQTNHRHKGAEQGLRKKSSQAAKAAVLR